MIGRRVDRRVARLARLWLWPHRIPGLQYGDVWFVPAILGALALIIVAFDVATMRRSARQ